ncbi:DUF2339 domain-containing protein [Simiduia sp. 21SJ11W-1]|uniref:DUF2339 domain-containing protein n=1 Tax=Simiduia sp. 21SJ11W-1 TaxID=2909669 RepID=UPI0020A1F23F|nr:DUF2339 domain-containing protein [Simiduia sp. 21SJ11W-1]UTA46633.1 DUF2339 domain-containing protein [Simiduia sp. 21SJ11W-1]
MEVLGLVLVGLILAVIIGAILGFSAFMQVRQLREDLTALRRDLGSGKWAANAEAPAESTPKPPGPPASPDVSRVIQPSPKSYASSTPEPTSAVSAKAEGAHETDEFSLELDLDTEPSPPSDTPRPPQPLLTGPDFWARLQQQWMVWLGGLCVGLAGVFLAKYSIEQGLLGPGARIAGGIVTGIALHLGALWLRAKQGAHPSFAALAGGGSITLFAAFLAALHLYQMFSPLTIFACLALVAVATLWLALLHGPVLAAIGMLGAYSVPLLVSTGSGNILAAMAYALIISASVLWLLRMVYRPWLWWGCIAGALLWWALSFSSVDAEHWRLVYLAVLAYITLAIPGGNFWLRFTPADDEPHWPLRAIVRHDDTPPALLTHIAIWAAFLMSLLVSGWSGAWLSWLLLPALTLWLASSRVRYTCFGWAGFLGVNGAVLLHQLHEDAGQWAFKPLAAAEHTQFFAFLSAFAALFMGFALRNLKLKTGAWWPSLLAMVPILQLFTGYLLAENYASVWQWAMLAFLLAATAMWLAFMAQSKTWPKALTVWLLLAGHFAYALIAAWLLDEATLTLAVASQLLSLAWVMKRFDAPELGWLFKLIAVIVVVRLTLNPWLASYTQSGHWTLWTYGGATAMCYLAARWLALMPALARWAEAAALHLLVLTLWSEARYWLHDGNVYAAEFSAIDAVVNLSLFCALGLVYHLKATLGAQLAAWYRAYAKVLLAASALNYLALVMAFFSSSQWLWGEVGTRPMMNLLLGAFGLPIVWCLLIRRYYPSPLSTWMPLLAAGAGLLFLTVEIRHLWQGTVSLKAAVLDGELYTYSVVWLLCAVAALLGGSWRWGKRCYRAGMLLLAVVIVKIFMVDMADLQGLWRVASFMGLGLALLGVAFLHQKIQQNVNRA